MHGLQLWSRCPCKPPVFMLLKIRSMCGAKKALDKLDWSPPCGGDHMKFEQSVLHQNTHHDSMHCDNAKLAALLKTCGELKDAKTGVEIHSEISRKGLSQKDPFLGNTLINMYVKCGLLLRARHVFDELPTRDVYSWTALIAGYSKHEHPMEALKCFERMQLDGVCPNFVTYICSLKACGALQAVDKGHYLHSEIARQGLLEKSIALASALVDMYAKCGFLTMAQEVFDKLQVQDVVLWTTLIAGYVKHGQGREAIELFGRMQLEGVSPNPVTFVCSLKACGNLGVADKGLEIHAEIARRGSLEKDQIIANTLVDMYAKCGLLGKAQEVFDKLPIRDAISWNALISGYVKHEHGMKALHCFRQMKLAGVSPDAFTFVCTLKACASIGAFGIGSEIHAEISQHDSLERDHFVGNALVDMYSKCGFLANALDVFHKLLVRDVASWNALIEGYAKHESEEALNLYEKMQRTGISPNAHTFACCLNVCGSIGATIKGKELHVEIDRRGLLDNDPVIGNALVDMYAKCGSLSLAQQVFDDLLVRDVVSWTGLIAGYAKHDFNEEALTCLEQMQLDGVPPDSVVYACSLKACAGIKAMDKGKDIHAELARNGSLGRDPVLGKALLDMYAKCGAPATAQEVFDKLSVRDTVAWTTLIAGYAELDYGEEALKCYEQMQHERVLPDDVTFICVLKGCGSIGALDKGRKIHEEITRKGLLETDLVVGNTLIDMYAKCGSLSKAQEVFERLPVRDVISWNALIAGYVQLGESERAFNIYGKMIAEGEKPDLVTFFEILHACSHAGLVNQGLMYFEVMTNGYGLNPTLEHDTCMIYLFCQAGQVERAVQLAKELHAHADLVVWQVVLDACRKWGNVELGKIAFEHAMQLDEEDLQENTNKAEAGRLNKQAGNKLGSFSQLDGEGTLGWSLVGDESCS